MFEGWANVEALLRSELPLFVVVGLGVDEIQTAKGDNWSGIVIELAIEALPGRELWSDSGLSKEVQG